MDIGGKKDIYYAKSQLVETVCQLRFPAILSIEAKEPADFQDAVRGNFPRYLCGQERPSANGGQSIKNYSFISADGTYRLNLTRSFISLSTLRYASWSKFAGWLDEPLGRFISIYKPAYFERIGLRYVNGFSRSALGLDGCRWSELIAPQYLGILAAGDTEEKSVARCSVDVDMKLDDGCALKLHAGPGQVRRTVRSGDGLKTIQENETRFILDIDVFRAGNIKLQDAAAVLEKIHERSDRVFSGAISGKLHDAMGPTFTL